MLFRGILVWRRHSWYLHTKEYNPLPFRRTAWKFVHQGCGTQSKIPPTSHSQDVLGLKWLLCWSRSWTELVTTHPLSKMVPSLRCSDERSLQYGIRRRYWHLRRSLGWSRPRVQVQSRILQNISNREKCKPPYADYIYFTSQQRNCGLEQHNK